MRTEELTKRGQLRLQVLVGGWQGSLADHQGRRDHQQGPHVGGAVQGCAVRARLAGRRLLYGHGGGGPGSLVTG